MSTSALLVLSLLGTCSAIVQRGESAKFLQRESWPWSDPDNSDVELVEDEAQPVDLVEADEEHKPSKEREAYQAEKKAKQDAETALENSAKMGNAMESVMEELKHLPEHLVKHAMNGFDDTKLEVEDAHLDSMQKMMKANALEHVHKTHHDSVLAHHREDLHQQREEAKRLAEEHRAEKEQEAIAKQAEEEYQKELKAEERKAQRELKAEMKNKKNGNDLAEGMQMDLSWENPFRDEPGMALLQKKEAVEYKEAPTAPKSRGMVEAHL